MDNQAQMKQELEYWDQADTQPSTSDTLPIPQQNQQSDIQPMFEIRQHATRKHSAANQHINTAPRHPANYISPQHLVKIRCSADTKKQTQTEIRCSAATRKQTQTKIRCSADTKK